MDPYDLTISQLKRAASIKERLERLTKELRFILGASGNSRPVAKKRTMSAAVRKKIAATQKARWAKLRRAKMAARAPERAAKSVKKRVSQATREKLRAKLKAYWAAKKAGKK